MHDKLIFHLYVISISSLKPEDALAEMRFHLQDLYPSFSAETVFYTCWTPLTKGWTVYVLIAGAEDQLKLNQQEQLHIKIPKISNSPVNSNTLVTVPMGKSVQLYIFKGNSLVKSLPLPSNLGSVSSLIQGLKSHEDNFHWIHFSDNSYLNFSSPLLPDETVDISAKERFSDLTFSRYGRPPNKHGPMLIRVVMVSALILCSSYLMIDRYYAKYIEYTSLEKEVIKLREENANRSGNNTETKSLMNKLFAERAGYPIENILSGIYQHADKSTTISKITLKGKRMKIEGKSNDPLKYFALLRKETVFRNLSPSLSSNSIFLFEGELGSD